MPVEKLKEYREVELDIDTDGITVAELWTELPGQQMVLRYSHRFNTEDTTPGRRPVNFRVPGTSKGKLARVRLTTAAAVRVYGAKVLGRFLGSNSPCGWMNLPVEPTPNVFTAALLPIEPTPEIYGAYLLPIPETPLVPIWVTVPVDPV